MARIILQQERNYANRVFTTEWDHQLTTIEQSVNFYEEYFIWASQQIRKLHDGESAPQEYAEFYMAEAPEVIKEIREALQVLRLMCQRPNHH